MNTLSAGRYLEGNSPLHRMDGFAKLLCLLLVLTAAILSRGVLSFIPPLALTLSGILLSGIGRQNALRGLVKISPFLILIFLMNALFFAGESPLWQWWIFRLTLGGIAQGARVVLRVTVALLLGNLLVTTTPPLSLIAAFETLLSPLRFLGIPVREVAMVLGVAFRFIPLIAEESAQLKKAQIARGARFESRRLRDKARCVLPLVIPLFLASFRRADELALAMEARGYRRTKQKTTLSFRLQRKEFLALTLCSLTVLFEILLLIGGTP